MHRPYKQNNRSLLCNFGIYSLYRWNLESGKTHKGKGGIDVITLVMRLSRKKTFMFTAATSEYAYIFKHFDHFYMLSAVLISSTLLSKKLIKYEVLQK